MIKSSHSQRSSSSPFTSPLEVLSVPQKLDPFSPKTEYTSVVSLLQPCHAGSKTRPQRAFTGFQMRFWQPLVFNAWMKETTLWDFPWVRQQEEKKEKKKYKKKAIHIHTHLKNILTFQQQTFLKQRYNYITQSSVWIMQWCVCSETNIYPSCLIIAYQRDLKMLN